MAWTCAPIHEACVVAQKKAHWSLCVHGDLPRFSVAITGHDWRESKTSDSKSGKVVLAQDGSSGRWAAPLTLWSICTRRPQILYSTLLSGASCHIHLLVFFASLPRSLMIRPSSGQESRMGLGYAYVLNVHRFDTL